MLFRAESRECWKSCQITTKTTLENVNTGAGWTLPFLFLQECSLFSWLCTFCLHSSRVPVISIDVLLNYLHVLRLMSEGKMNSWLCSEDTLNNGLTLRHYVLLTETCCAERVRTALCIKHPTGTTHLRWTSHLLHDHYDTNHIKTSTLRYGTGKKEDISTSVRL